MSKSNIKNSILLFSNDHNEPEWVKKERLNAYKKIEDYNHPSFGPEIKLDFNLNEYFENTSISFHLEEEGFIVCDIHTAFIKYKGLIEKYYGKLISSEENRYTNLNTIAFESGYFIYVFKNKKLDFPIFNRNVNCDLVRNIIIVDENSTLNFIDYNNSSSTFRGDCTEVFVEKNAKCNYLNLNMNDTESTLVSIKRALVEEKAEMNWINIITGSKIFMSYPSSILKGKKSSSTSTTLSLVDNKSSINIGAKMIHQAPFTCSTIKNIGNIVESGELETRNVVDINKEAVNSKSSVTFKYSANAKSTKYDNVPRYIVDNDSSNISFNMKNASSHDLDIIKFIECNFIELSNKNKKILLNLIKRDN